MRRAAMPHIADIDTDTRQTQAAAGHQQGRQRNGKQARDHLAAPLHAMAWRAEATTAVTMTTDIQMHRVGIADTRMHTRRAETATRQPQRCTEQYHCPDSHRDTP